MAYQSSRIRRHVCRLARPEVSRQPQAAHAIEHFALLATSTLYSLARVFYAPNPSLCALFEKHTNRPCLLMQRGVDTGLFSP
jgi:predicted RNase H-like nuclease